MSISYKELIGNYTVADIPYKHLQNIDELLKRINIIRDAYGNPMTVTSGYRSEQDHLKIYSKKGVPRNKVPMFSAHLSGEAVDIYDLDGKLANWLKNDPKGITTLEVVANLYCEEDTKGWVHFQLRPPRSGKRWFKP